jgi:hypothetical protein
VTIQVSQTAGDFYNELSSTFDVVLSKTSPTISGATQKSFTYGTSGTGYNGTTEVDLTALGISSNSNGSISYSKIVDTDNAASLSNSLLTFTKAGTVTIQVDQTFDSFYNASNSVTFTVQLSPINPTITNVSQKSFTYGTSGTGYTPNTNEVDLSAFNISSNSSGTVSFTIYSDPNSIGTLSNNILTFSKAGTIIIRVNQTADNFYNALSALTIFQVVINKASQTVSFVQSNVTIDNVDVYTNTVALSDRATSATSGINAIQYTLYNTSSDIAVISGQNILLKSPGTITLQANQNSSDNYNASNTAEQTITVNFVQNVSMVSNTIIYENTQPNDTVSLSGYATSSTNNPIQYVLVNTPSSVAEIQTVTVRGLDVINEQVLVIKGTGIGTIQAVQSSSTGYSTTTTTDFTNWRILGNYASSVAMDSVGLKMFRSYLYAAQKVPQYSIDKGATWVDIPELFNDGDERFAVNADSTVIVCGSKYSINGGTTWVNYASYPDGQQEPDKLVMTNSGTKWFTMTSGLLHVSTNYGQSWTQVGPTLNNRWQDICMSDNGTVLMACATDGVYIISGGNWTKRVPTNLKEQSDNAFCSSIACDASGNIIYLSVSLGFLYRSEDQGKNWLKRNVYKDWNRIACTGDGKVVVAANNASAGTYGQVWTSIDQGNNWQTQTITQPGYGTVRNFTQFAMSRNTGTYILAVSGTGFHPLVMSTRTSVEFTIQQSQFVSFVEILNRSFVVDTDVVESDVVESEESELTRDLTMTPEVLYIDNVQYGHEVSIDGLATSDTQNINPIIYFADSTNCASISGTTMTILEPGTFTLKAYQASFSYYSKSNYAEKQVTIVFATSVLFIDKPLTKTYLDAPFIPEVQTLLVDSYSFSLPPNNGVATTNGTTVTLIGAGTVTLTVSQNVSGNANYTASTDTTSLVVNKASQTLTFTEGNMITKPYSSPPFTLSVTSSAGYSDLSFSVPENNGVLSLSGNTFSPIGVGSVIVTATQAANANFASASQTTLVVLSKGTQNLTFETIYKHTMSLPFSPVVSTNASPSYSSYTFSVPANNGVVTTDGNLIYIVGEGVVTVTATQAANDLYNSATVSTTMYVCSVYKRNYINLWDDTFQRRFRITQSDNQTVMTFESITFVDQHRSVPDIVSQIRRIQPIHTQISTAESRTEVVEIRSESLTTRTDVQHTQITNKGSAMTRVLQTNTSLHFSLEDQYHRLDQHSSQVATRISENTSLSSRTGQYDSTLDRQGSVITRLVGENTSLSSRISQYDSTLARQGSDINWLIEENTLLSSRIHIAHNDIALKGSQMTLVSQTQYALHNSLITHEHQIDQRGSKMTTLSEQNTSLATRLNTHHSNIGAKGTQMTTRTNQNTSLGSRLDEVYSTTAETATHITSVQTQNISLLDKISVQHSQIATRGVAMDTILASQSDLSTRLEPQQSFTAAKGSTMTSVLAHNNLLSLRLDSTAQRCLNEKSNIETSIHANTSLSTRTSEFETNLHPVHEDIHALVIENNTLIQRVDVQHSHIHNQGSQTQEIKQRNDSLIQRFDVCAQHISERASTMVEVHSRNTNTQSLVQRAEQQASSVHSQVETIDSELANIVEVLLTVFDGDASGDTVLSLILDIITHPERYSVQALSSRLQVLETSIEDLTDSTV